jgi:hypothetical protein
MVGQCYTEIFSDRMFKRMALAELLFSFYFAILGTYLSIVLRRVLKQNGRVLDKIGGVLERIDRGFERVDKGLELIAKLIVEENEKTRREILNALAR